ncbi:phosphotransferase family protein [Croceicoccus pelagius]|uniref:Aminoglycoside phosphotransferase domain-containing protein n=1 Tax=Croceicoccus pelagius TaxID=1703341 RepID=A0A916Y8S2_9SPHN|nr:aminoglycoside phosphotransferase family protein [Croceicoccus pelagius]GGD34818.1 hypothetical protein GCM10010989_06220 [Croceicoccus pelagius]
MAEVHPTASYAEAIAQQVTGKRADQTRRFTSGLVHYVFEVHLDDGSAVVVKAGANDRRQSLAASVKMTALLRPMGVPIPEIIASDLDARLPWVMMERVPGTDLGQILNSLTETQRKQVAYEVAQAQKIVGQLSTAGTFGYVTGIGPAQHRNLPDLLDEDFARLRKRISHAGLFGDCHANRLAETLNSMRNRLLEIRPIAFLHDTTTKNVIVDPIGGKVGIIDVENLCFGDPRYVIAVTSAMLLVAGQPQEYIQAWLTFSGLENDEVCELYVCLALLELMSEHGQNWSDIVVHSNEQSRSHLLHIFDAKLSCLNAKVAKG